jgi:hypothetical protein
MVQRDRDHRVGGLLAGSMKLDGTQRTVTVGHKRTLTTETPLSAVYILSDYRISVFNSR